MFLFADRQVSEASTVAGNMSNAHSLSQAEQILQPHSNAMIEAPGGRWVVEAESYCICSRLTVEGSATSHFWFVGVGLQKAF